MNLNITVNEASAVPAAPNVASKNVRVRFNEVDAGQVSGPFTVDAAQAFSVAAIGRSGVVSVSVEDAV